MGVNAFASNLVFRVSPNGPCLGTVAGVAEMQKAAAARDPRLGTLDGIMQAAISTENRPARLGTMEGFFEAQKSLLDLRA